MKADDNHRLKQKISHQFLHWWLRGTIHSSRQCCAGQGQFAGRRTRQLGDERYLYILRKISKSGV